MHDATHASLDRYATQVGSAGSGPARRGAFRLGAALLLLVLAHGQAQPASGTRVMHYASSATIQGVRTQHVANSQGRFVDPRTGQGFSLEEIGGTSAGHGFTQLDFVHVDAGVCVGVVTSFGMDAFTSAVTTLSTSAFVSDGGQCADFWIDPAALARMPESSSFERMIRADMLALALALSLA